MVKRFVDKESASVADDHEGDPVFLARNAWHLDDAAKEWPDLQFLTITDQTLAARDG